MDNSDNPLLDMQFKVPFDRINASHVEAAAGQRLVESKARLNSLAGSAGPRTYANTMQALEEITRGLDYAMAVAGHMESVATTPDLRTAWNNVQEPVSELHSSILFSGGIWNALNEYAGTADARELDPVRARFLRKTVDEFRRHGAALLTEQKKRLSEIAMELATLTTKFSQNVLDATNAFEMLIEDEDKLAGLPESAVRAARADAEAKGKKGWRFTLQAPSLTAVLTYLDDEKIREQVYWAAMTRATSGDMDNRPLIARILALRSEEARLLSYANFADYVLEDRMAGTGERAILFVEDLRRKTEDRFRKENEELRNFRQEMLGKGAGDLKPWDVGYWAEKQRKVLYDFDEEALRPYFPFPRVLAGMFEIARRLYGIRITETDTMPVWHPSVRTFAVHDSDGSHLGSFYADFFPRETKRGGAWMDALITGEPGLAGFKPHLGLICGNLTPPMDGRPALLTHTEVETIFHEFGHLLHHLLSRVPVRSLAGTHVAWDFVELPSQIMENWCWEREALDLFARHWSTNETIPEELFRKLTRARNFRSAAAMMRQLGFAWTDLALHVKYDPEHDGDVVEFARKQLAPFSASDLPPGYAMIASFTHLFSSPVAYAAGYYSYKWAEVLDADAFSRFRREGIFNPETGREFRRHVLSRGDSDDPMELYKRFMGREPDPSALLNRSGLL
ncbi:MAG: M3 family metallopeptidase [Deltaproteobacteria bacterium]|nr:M3 family metallopeptidase [Deltaproteobacteria bacterium]